MNLRIFWTALFVGFAFVAIQGVFSAIDGRLSQTQLDDEGISNSWSFLQHGGMWADVLIISPLVAFALSKYKLDYSSAWGVTTLAFSAIFTLVMVDVYRHDGIQMGDHCTHDGKTTVAGWIHAAYAFAAIWVILEIYLGLTTPVVSKTDIIYFSILLTPFFYLGVSKFHHLWRPSQQDMVQVSALTTLVWCVAAYRLVYA